MVLTLEVASDRHKVTIPRHRDVHIGTLDAVISAVAAFLRLSKEDVSETLFG